MTLPEATESTKDQETRRQVERGEDQQEERTKRTENLHTQDMARERVAKKAKDEAVKNVA